MAPRQARRAQARGPGGQWQGSGYWWRSHSKGLHLFITQSPAPSDRDRNYAHHPSPPETTGKGFGQTQQAFNKWHCTNQI